MTQVGDTEYVGHSKCTIIVNVATQPISVLTHKIIHCSSPTQQLFRKLLNTKYKKT